MKDEVEVNKCFFSFSSDFKLTISFQAAPPVNSKAIGAATSLHGSRTVSDSEGYGFVLTCMLLNRKDIF